MRKIIEALVIILAVGSLAYVGYWYFIFRPAKKKAPTVYQPTVTKQKGDLFRPDLTKPTALDEWEIKDDVGTVEGPSRWKLIENTILQNSNIWGGTFGTDPTNKSYLGTKLISKSGDKWTDYSLEVKFQPQDNDGVGFLVHFKDEKNYYKIFTIMDDKNNNGGPVLKIDKFSDGNVKTLAKIEKTYTLYEWNTIRIIVIGGKIKVYLNDIANLILETEDKDNPFTQGKIGLTCFAMEGIYFKDIVVSETITSGTVPELEKKSGNR